MTNGGWRCGGRRGFGEAFASAKEQAEDALLGGGIHRRHAVDVQVNERRAEHVERLGEVRLGAELAADAS